MRIEECPYKGGRVSHSDLPGWEAVAVKRQEVVI